MIYYSELIPACSLPVPLERPLLDSADPDSQGAQQNQQPDGLQPAGNAAPGRQVQQLCTDQHPQAPPGTPALPDLVHGHPVGCAEVGRFPEAGEEQHAWDGGLNSDRWNQREVHIKDADIKDTGAGLPEPLQTSCCASTISINGRRAGLSVPAGSPGRLVGPALVLKRHCWDGRSR